MPSYAPPGWHADKSLLAIEGVTDLLLEFGSRDRIHSASCPFSRLIQQWREHLLPGGLQQAHRLPHRRVPTGVAPSRNRSKIRLAVCRCLHRSSVSSGEPVLRCISGPQESLRSMTLTRATFVIRLGACFEGLRAARQLLPFPVERDQSIDGPESPTSEGAQRKGHSGRLPGVPCWHRPVALSKTVRCHPDL